MAPLTSTTFESGELAEVVAVIRSLLLIRKQLTTVRDINDEYRKMEGENIPYHKFGFSSCELMLQRSNQFNLARQSNGQTIISAKLSKNDEHMAKLVQETQTKHKKPVKRSSFYPPVRQPSTILYRTGYQPRPSSMHQMPQRPMVNRYAPQQQYQQPRMTMPSYSQPRMPRTSFVQQSPLLAASRSVLAMARANCYPQVPRPAARVVQPQVQFNYNSLNTVRPPPMTQPPPQRQPEPQFNWTPLPPDVMQSPPVAVSKPKPSPAPMPPQQKQPEQRTSNNNTTTTTASPGGFTWTPLPKEEMPSRPIGQVVEPVPEWKLPEAKTPVTPVTPPVTVTAPPKVVTPAPVVTPSQPPLSKPQETKPVFNWTPLPPEQMQRHPITQAEIKFVQSKPTVTAPVNPSPTPAVIPKEPTQSVFVAPVPTPKPEPTPQPIPVILTTQQTPVFVAPSTLQPVFKAPSPPPPPTFTPQSIPVVERRFLNNSTISIKYPPNVNTTAQRHHVNSYHNKTPTLLQYPPEFMEKVRNTPAKSLESRLNVKPATLPANRRSPDSGMSSSTRTSQLRPISFVEEVDPSLVVLPATGGDPIEQLSAFCAQQKITASDPRILKSPFVYVCQLTVDGRTFSASAEKESEARAQVAENALAHLRLALQRKRYPVIQEDNHVLALRLYEMLLTYPGGVMEKDLPDLFQQTTGMSLPDNWTSVVTTYTRFFTVDSGPLAHVVYANEKSDEEIEQELLEEAQEEEEGAFAIESIMQLPWVDKHWNLYITSVVNCSMVWGRIIGVDFCENWDRLMTDLEVAMGEKGSCQRVEEVVPECMYLVERTVDGDKCWFRVRCQEVNEEERQVLGFFVDLGSEEWLAMDDLYECGEKFQVLAGQAVLFSLFGLESLVENPHAKPILDRHLQGQSMVATIVTKVEDYVEGNAIQALFYDTSSENDVNLCQVLHDKICAAGSAPQLKAQGLTQVIVTSVSERGQVFCQVPGSGVDYVQGLIEKVVLKEALERFRGLEENCSQGSGDKVTRYLVFDRETERYYRAVLKVRHPQSEDHLMHCLDTGNQVYVSNNDIYQLAPLSVALNLYPAMALRVALFDVPRMEPQLVSRVKGLLEAQTTALVKVMKVAGFENTPQVNIYQRMEANRIIVCINDTLRLESDFESSLAV